MTRIATHGWRPASYQGWAAATPEDFVFAVKGGRFITHMKKLRDVETPLANFLASGVLALGAKLGPLPATGITTATGGATAGRGAAAGRGEARAAGGPAEPAG